MSTSAPRLSALHRYPVKSCRGEALTSALVEPWGLAGDRRWMLVDDSGECATAREHPRMLLIEPSLDAEGGLVVGATGDLPELVVPIPDGATSTTVTVFRRTPFEASLAEIDAHAWFSKLLGASVRLVYAADPDRRHASVEFAGPGTPMAFADGYPLLVTTESSLAQLNELIAAGPRAAEGNLPMDRFRTNLVVSGTEAWAEDGWRQLRIGDAVLRAVKGCARCAIPTTDHRTAFRYMEPTATLARHRRWDGGVWFGMNLVPDTPGVVLTVGDDVEILESVAAPDGPPR